MPIILFDAIRRVRSSLNEPAWPTTQSPGYSAAFTGARMVSDTEITDWINDGLRDIARRAEELVSYDTTSLQIPAYNPSLTPLSTVPAYNLPDNMVRITRCEFVPSNTQNQVYKIEPAMQTDMDQIWGTYQQNASTYPRWFVTRGYPGGAGIGSFQIQFYPQPSQSGTCNLYYYKLPDRLSDPLQNANSYQDPLDLLEGWDDVAIEFAVYKAMQKMRSQEWQVRKAEYEEKIEQMVNVSRRFHDQQSYVSYGTSYLPGWLTGGAEW